MLNNSGRATAIKSEKAELQVIISEHVRKGKSTDTSGKKVKHRRYLRSAQSQRKPTGFISTVKYAQRYKGIHNKKKSEGCCS